MTTTAATDDAPWFTQEAPELPHSFDTNVGILVKELGTTVAVPWLPNVSCWTVNVRSTHTGLQLQVYKERLEENASTICDQCRIIGWQNHPVSRQRYHFIVPVVEGTLVCAHTPEDFAAFPTQEAYSAAPSPFDSHAHLLHGVVHANGFGHLARVNGREGGSQQLSGKQLMQMWDRLCHLLRMRQISVEDVSNKHGDEQGGMELRVLHAAANKVTWYGQWGYNYGRGAFNITHSKWKRAMDAVHRAKLLLLLADFAGVQSAVPAIVARYKAVGADCATLGALLKSMLDLLSKPQAAAQLLSSEAHSQASTFTAAPPLPPDVDPAGGHQSPDPQAAPASDAPVTEPAEAPKIDSWTFGKVAQPVLAELKYTVSQEAASDTAAGEAGGAEYRQSLPQAGAGSTPLPAQPLASEPELDTDTQANMQTPAEQLREPSQGPGHFAEGHLHADNVQPLGAGIPAVTTVEQAPAELHNELNDTSGVDANQQPLLQAAGTTGQQGTAAHKQIVAAGTEQVGGSTVGKAAKHKGGGKGAKTEKLGGQLTGSAAHALAVLQAGHPSRSTRTEEEAGGVAKEKKRNSNKTLGQNMAPMPASKLAYSLQGLEEVNLSTAPQRWSKERCRTCLAKVMSCLQGFEGWWVSRSVAREQVHKVIGDTGMMDYMLKTIANRTVGPWAVFRRSDPGDRDRMLFYLLIKKDGSTIPPAPDAVHPDFAPLPSSGESALQNAAALAVTHLQQGAHQTPASSVPAAAATAVESISHQAAPACRTSAAQVMMADPDQPAVQARADSVLLNPSLQQGLQQAAASELAPHLSGSTSGLLHPATSNTQACVPPQISLSAAPAPPLLSQSSCLPQPLLPQPAPASPQLQPVLPQLQPASPHQPSPSPYPAAAMPPGGQPSSQQKHQHVQGKAPQAAAGQDISKEFLALLQETSTHLAVSEPSWPDQAGSDPCTAQLQTADSRQSEAVTSAVEAEGIRPGGNVLASLHVTGPPVTSQNDEAGDQGVRSSYQDHAQIAPPAPSPAASPAPSVAASPAASPAPSTNSGLKGLLGEACSSIIAQQQARRAPSFKNVVATRVPASHTSPQSTPASVNPFPQHSTSQSVASPVLQSSPKSTHSLPAAVQLPSRQQRQQQQTHPQKQQEHSTLYSSNTADLAPLMHPALELHTQPTHRALFAQGHSNWLDNRGSAAWSGAASDVTKAGKRSDSALQEAQHQHQQQQPSAATFSGQIGNGDESGDEQLNDHNMWSQYLNSQPEPEFQPQPQAERQLRPEPESGTQHVMSNKLAPSLTQSAVPAQLSVSQSGPVLAQPTVPSVLFDQQLPVGPHSSSHATACSDGQTPVGKDEKERLLTRQCPVQMLLGTASMHVDIAQHGASMQAQHGADVAHVEADSIRQAAAQSTQNAEPEWLPTVEPAQQAQRALSTRGAMARGTDTQLEEGTETRSKGLPAELDSSGFSPQTESHHDLPADCAIADANHVPQRPSSRAELSDLQGSHSDGPEADQGLSLQSDDAQHAEQTPADALPLQSVGDDGDDPRHAQQASDAQAEEAQHAKQASGVQSEETQRAQQMSSDQSYSAQHAQQASDTEMDDVQRMPDIQTEQVEQPQQMSGLDTSQTQHAQQERIVQTQGPQQTPDVDGTASQHAKQANDAESPKPQQAADSALHEAQHAQQAPDVEMRDVQQAAGPAQQEFQRGTADTAEELPLQPRRSRRSKGPAQDSTGPQTQSATEAAPQDATKAAAEAAPDTKEEEAVAAPPATRSSAAKHAAVKTRSAKPAMKPAAKHNGAHKAAGLQTHKHPGPSSQHQQQQQQPPATRSHKKQPKRQRLTASEGVGQQTASKASAAAAGKQVQEAAQELNAAGDGTGGAPLRRRTRHSGVDVMEALDDPDIMLRSDPNLSAKVSPQAASSKPQQNSCQHATPDTSLPATASKGCSTQGKQPTVLVTDSQAATGRLPRLRRASHTDTDSQVKESEGHDQQAEPSLNAGTSSQQQQHRQQQRRSLRQPTKAQGGQHAVDPPAAEGVHVKPHSKQGLVTSLTAGKGKSKAAALAEQKAEGPKQVAGALKNGKKAAASRWKPAELEGPFDTSAKGKKSLGSKGHPKGLPPHSAGKGKSPIGTKQPAKAVAQSPAHEGKPALDAKKEPAASPVQGDSIAHGQQQSQQQSPGASDLPCGLGKGKRKRTATKPLHMDEVSQAEEHAGSTNPGMGGKLKEEQVYRSHKRAKTEKPSPGISAGLPLQAAAATSVLANKGLRMSAPARSMPGLHAKPKSASWSHHSTKTSAAMSAKRVHKAYTAASMHAADRLSLHESAADLAAGSEAEPAAAAARKGKAQLTYSRSGLQHGGSFHKGTSAEQHKGTDGQMAAMPPSHSRLRVKAIVDYNQAGARDRSAGPSRARSAASRRPTAPSLALVSTQPPMLLTPQPWQSLQPGAPFDPRDGVTPRDQVLCDLVYLFNNVLRCYAPAVGHEIVHQPAVVLDPAGLPVYGHGTAAGLVPASSQVEADHVIEKRKGRLKLGALAADVQALRDVKHFVKDYKGHLPLSLPSPGGAASNVPEAAAGSPGQVRLLLQVILPEEEIAAAATRCSPISSAAQSSASARFPASEVQAGGPGRGVSLPPPVEPLLVARRTPLSMLKKAAEEHMAEIYSMLERWQVTDLTGLEAGELRAKIGSNVMDNTVVSLAGTDIELAPHLRHAGGFEDWVVSCTCGTKVDDGERMVECEVCGVWLHTRCQGVPDAGSIPDDFVCSKCAHVP